jgi:hypothetical protein
MDRSSTLVPLGSLVNRLLFGRSLEAHAYSSFNGVWWEHRHG